MANELFQNLLSGTLTADPGSGGTTLTSANLASMQVVAGTDFQWVTIDPLGVVAGHTPEIVKVSAHTAAATTATIVRGQQGTSAQAWPIGTTWSHDVTKAELDKLPHRLMTTTGDTLIATGANAPARLAVGGVGKVLAADPAATGLPAWVNGYVVGTTAQRPAATGLEGVTWYATDTDRWWVSDGTSWVFAGYSSTAGRPGVVLTDAAQSFTSGAAADITWGTEVLDLDGWTSGGIATLTVPTGWSGWYQITFTGTWSAGSGTTSYVNAVYNAASYAASNTTQNGLLTLSFTRQMAATDTLKFSATQNSGGAVNLDSRLEVVWLDR